MRCTGRSRGDAAMNAIALRDVTLAFGRRIVLADVNLDIAEGEFVAVLGPNGAGKTTLLRAVLGLVPPLRGEISVLGRLARRGNPAVGYLPQASAAGFGVRISGREFVASAVNGHRLGLPIAGRRGRNEVERVLDLVGAAALGRRPLGELSGGERHRLLLAQALIGRPRLLLLDEPLISLDPHREREAVEIVRRVQRELGIAVLFSAHEINPLLGAIDRLLYLGACRAEIGTVAEVVTGPVLSRLYGVPIEVVRLDGRIFVMSGGQPVEVAAHRHAAHAWPAHDFARTH